MIVDKNSGLIDDVTYIASPNCDARPTDEVINLLVIHGISLPPNEFGGDGIIKLFTNQLDHTAHAYYQQLQNVRVSAHCLIRRDGELLQFVPFTQRAWHAGVSEFQGRERCNDFSIGIELEGTDDLAYTGPQYSQLKLLIAAIRVAYPSIDDDRIVGHSDIAPGRKTDPGPAFDWQQLKH